MALVWFLIRVIPRPSRARYPCQRVAFPLASGFVVWLLGAVGSLGLLRKARSCFRRARWGMAAAMVSLTVGVLLTLSVTDAPGATTTAAAPAANQPVGVAKGVQPGRVVWAHHPGAVAWTGPGTGSLWYQNISGSVVRRMLDRAVVELAGRDSIAEAWDALFRYSNRARGRGEVGYRPGEKIAIKVNHTLMNEADPMRMGKPWQHADLIGNSPQLTVALLEQLTGDAGVAPEDISIGDPSRIMPNFYYRAIHRTPGLEDVVCLTRYGHPASGRRLVAYSEVPLHWSDADADRTAGVTVQDRLPASFAEADYLINFAVLKSHEMNGVTLCAKNHYGSLIRNPVVYDRYHTPKQEYYSLHATLPDQLPGMGHYRAVVDLTGHKELGGKTVLYLIDGLIAGRGWAGNPRRWEMEPFNGDWPESIFLSQDPVAIDSVGFDFLRAEWADGYPAMPGVLDHLREAALAGEPPSGTFYDPEGDGRRMKSLGVEEHWDNPREKQYSRNLGTGEGIELVRVAAGE